MNEGDNIRGRKVESTHGNLSLVITDDGSHTLYNKELDETYHSLSGAFSESLHVFIEAGLLAYLKNHPQLDRPLNILEVGWGTGLNCILTMERAPRNLPIHYLALEPHPLDGEVAQRLNYPGFIADEFREMFSLMHRQHRHQQGPGVIQQLSPHFSLHKVPRPLEDLGFEEIEEWRERLGGIDLIYFDAFAMGKQSDPWKEENFFRLKKMMARGAVLVTYASTRPLKARLEAQGLRVEILPGPPPKREMTRAFN